MPKLKNLQKATDRQIVNRYDAIIKNWYKQAAGGTQYGIDWPTARVLWPDDYAEIQELKAEAKRRRAAGTGFVSAPQEVA